MKVKGDCLWQIETPAWLPWLCTGQEIGPTSHIMAKDLLMTLALFLFLVGPATFVEVPRETKANLSDSSYISRGAFRYPHA